MLFANHKKRSRLNPRENPQRNRPELDAPIYIIDASVSGSVLSLTFDQQVNLDGVPEITTDVAGAEPLSAVKTSPTSVDITFSAAVAAATELNIPWRDRAIRNLGGGYVYSPTFPLAA